MPAAEELDRIGALVDALAPLGQMTRGRVLRSEDWNALVAGVVELAKLAVARGDATNERLKADYAPRSHAHLGEVDASWLAPDLATQLEGVRGVAELRDLMTRVGQTVNEVQTGLAEVKSEVASLRSRVDRLEDGRDVDETNVARLGARVEEMRDLEARVDQIGNRFTGIDARVGQALELRTLLLDAAGTPIDIRAMQGRVGSLEELRENLRATDGTLVRYRDFERRVAQLEERTVTEAKVAEVVVGQLRSGTALETLAAGVLEKTRLETEERLSPVRTELGGLRAVVDGVTTRITAQEGELALIGTRVVAVEGQVSRIGPMAAQLDAQAVRLNAAESTLVRHGADLGGLANVPGALGTLARRMERVEAISPRVTTLETELGRVGQQVLRIDDIEGRVARVERLREDFDALRPRLAQVELATSQLAATVKSVDARVVLTESVSRDAATRLGVVEREVVTIKNRSPGPVIGRLEPGVIGDADLLRRG